MEKIREFQIKSVNQTFSSLKKQKILNTSEYFEDEFKKSTFSFEKILFIISLFSKIPKFVMEFLLFSLFLYFQFSY